MDASTPNSQRRPFSIKLWPPSQNTRSMLVERITNNLSSQSIFTRKYGGLSKEEAGENAKEIEDSAFASANLNYENEPDGDGSSAVQLYAKECSKLILEVLKRGPITKVDGEVVKIEKIPGPHETFFDISKGQRAFIEAGEAQELLSPLTKEDGEVVKIEKIPGPHETFFDISKGQRAFIEAEEAQELLSPLKEPGNSYNNICFSNRSFGQDAARIAEPILLSLKGQLQEVDLSDFIAGRSEEEALTVMNIFSEALEGSVLKYLNLSNNALGEKGVRAFGKLLKSQSSLEELYLMNDGISEEAARAVCELIPSTDKLRVLQFHNNMTGDEGAIAISEIVRHSSILEDFRCSTTRVGSGGGIALSEALGKCTHLKKLDLRDNMFGVEAGVVLSKALLNHANLTEVYLSYLNLEDEGTIAIANALKVSAPSLEVLEMAGNDITAEGAPSLAACIVGKKSLTKLSLAENELKDGGAIQIGKALEESHGPLKEVDMSSNLIRRAGARVLAQALVGKPEFKLLNLDGNFISEEGIDELKGIFKASPDLLGSLDENDPDGVDDEDEEEKAGDEDEGDEDDLQSKLKNLDVNSEE